MSDSRAFRSGNVGILLLLAVALLLSACADRSHMGIPLTEGASDPTFRSLAEPGLEARLDKMPIGEAFAEAESSEQPVMDERQVRHALAIYRHVARRTRGFQIYQPGVGANVRSTTRSSNSIYLDQLFAKAQAGERRMKERLEGE